MLMGRLVSHKMESEEDFDATRWLDRSLIRLCRCVRVGGVCRGALGARRLAGWIGRFLEGAVLGSPALTQLPLRLHPHVLLPSTHHRHPHNECSRFGDYRKDDPDSFQLRPQLSYYPQFMFNFRRSQFIQVGGAPGVAVVVAVVVVLTVVVALPGAGASRLRLRLAPSCPLKDILCLASPPTIPLPAHLTPPPPAHLTLPAHPTRPLAPPPPPGAGVWQLAGRDRVRAHHAEPRGRRRLDADAAAHAVRLLLCGPA